MIRAETFLDLEASLANRLTREFAASTRSQLLEAQAALDAHDFERAVEVVNRLSLRPALDNARSFIAWHTNLAMLFGASRVTAKPGTSVVGLGYEKLATQQAVDAFIQMLVETGEAFLRQQALQLIALERDKVEPVAKAIDTTQLNSFDPKQRILKPFESFVDSTGRAFFNMASSLHTSRVSAYGFTAEANALGMTEYQISEQLDPRTCPVCEVMHGKTFRVSDARALLGVVLRVNSPEDLKYLQPWPAQNDKALAELKAMTPNQLVQKGWHIPPFHPRCRGLLTRVGKAPKLDQIQNGTVPQEGPYKAAPEDFQVLGYPTPTPAQLARYNASIGLAPAEVVANLRGKPLDVFLQGLLSADSPKTYSGLEGFSIGKKNVAFVIQGADHGSDKLVSTSVTASEDATLTLKSLHTQDSTFFGKAMKRVLQALYTTAQDAGLEKIAADKVLISDGYEWARRGFKPTMQGWKSLATSIRHDLPDAKWYAALSPEFKAALDGILASPDPESVYKLADLGVIGKKTLSANHWTGYLPINDSEAVARFLLYLGG